ncbi:MAG: AraC family transcriptional regulator [Bacteroidota bacterium]
MTTLQININDGLLEQFASQLPVKRSGEQLLLQSSLGRGQIKQLSFPGEVKLLHFTFQLSTPLALHSHNPPDTDWVLLNINLSAAPIEKTVNEKVVEIQRYLPSGILFYPPDTTVSSASQPEVPYEIALLRIKKTFLQESIIDGAKIVQDLAGTICYEDLDASLEVKLRAALEAENKLRANAETLNFLARFFEKLSARNHEGTINAELHPDDLKGLFVAAAHLRNPLAENLPSLGELAGIAGMGITKFKTSFKQVFGFPPFRYHQKIRMEYAKAALQQGHKSATELSYELGYSHPSKFTLAFKKHFGELPSAASHR